MESFKSVTTASNKLRRACIDHLPMDFTLIADPSTLAHLMPPPLEIEELMRRLNNID